jgi:hypothetical protein
MNPLTRRHFFSKTANGLGNAALASLVSFKASAHDIQPDEASNGLPHHQPQAKRAIYLFMSGGPSQIDMWDPKPKLLEWQDRELPASVRQDQRLTTMTSTQQRLPILPSRYSFSQHGQSGTYVSELLPHMANKVDEIAVVRTVWTEEINHDPAITYICTGHPQPGKASLGAWLSYGLGSENENLPAFVVMTATWSGRQEAQALFSRLWGSGFLPSEHQGVALRNSQDPILFIKNPAGVNSIVRRRMLDSLSRLNSETYRQHGDPETLSRIAQYEMAYRLQINIPELTDLSDEPQHILDLYGPEVTRPGSFAYCCLMSRRLAERGVRFTQLFHRGWDQHDHLNQDLPKQCRDIDQPCAGLLTDLRQRGLLDDTLVIWGGEFGRTVYCQGSTDDIHNGRDHHPKCFTVWLAGAGIRPGVVHGETDEFGYNIDRDPVHIHDLNATIYHILGVDHQRFVYPFQGLDQRLTGVEVRSLITPILNRGLS